ncbi:MAG: hypothetical protein A2622_05725 [Bdellovibrionales bacterium RIFCSPHIGHO2_01_FULL_40_29]|nr:MAG: hypothetical protein A2622_05725 [Bdellovibrionales bacterium RIFCSPHIGHO2_01_FULL_40_29]OFZ35171.1 MAG: hypothetical protein A3D17_06075 [Bdellovibrionales bacterium RIFCSPHIGHO2_02_FULL_40_15]
MVSELSNPISIPIQNWVQQTIQSAEEFSIYQLAGDASARKYYRIISGEKTWILMFWEPFQEETYPFLSVQRHFKLAHVNVPTIVAVNGDLGVLLQEDLGDLTLERKFLENTNQLLSKAFYHQAIDEIIKIHDVATTLKNKTCATEIMFDTAKFIWEMNYAKEHLLLGILNYKMTTKRAAELDRVFADFCERLHQEPKVICHRDYHSRNIMLKLDKVFVIDFQDARLGPVQYDLVSLFKDSYVDLSDEYAHSLMNYYFENSSIKKTKDFSLEKFQVMYELQSVQRCFKACGSFASFMNVRKDRRYLKYLPHTIKRVARSLSHFPEYKLLMDVLIDSDALNKNYESL